MRNMSKRLLIGFGARALSHVIFQGALGTTLYAADLLPELVWSLKPVPPLAVPTTVNNMFWDGLWGTSLRALGATAHARVYGQNGGRVARPHKSSMLGDPAPP